MFCRFATMGVTNSRYNTAAKLQIRQNKGNGASEQSSSDTPNRTKESWIYRRWKRLRSVTVGRNDLRKSHRPTTSTLKEWPVLLQYDALLLAERFCFASILKNKSGKTIELILRFSALLFILQGWALRTLLMTLIKAFGFPNSEQTMVGAYGTRSFVHSTNSRV